SFTRTNMRDRMHAAVLQSIRNNVMIADNNDTLIYMNNISHKSLTELEPQIQDQFPNFSVNKAIGASIHNMHKDPDRIKRVLQSLKPGEIHTAQISVGGQILELNVAGIFDGKKRLGS